MVQHHRGGSSYELDHEWYKTGVDIEDLAAPSDYDDKTLMVLSSAHHSR